MKNLDFLILFCLIFICVDVTTASSGDNTPNELPNIWNAQQAVAFAKKNNPNTAIALKNIEEAQANTTQAKAANFPKIHFSTEYGQTNNSMYSFGNILNQGDFNTSIDFNDPGRTDNLQLKASILYQLYNGGRDQAQIASAAEQINLTQTELSRVHHQLSFEVVRIYQAIIEAENMVVVRQEAVDAIDAALDVGKARYEAGDLLKQDLLNLELQQARASEDLIQSQHTLELTKRIFLNLLGLKEGHVRVNSEDDIGQELPVNIDFTSRHEWKRLLNVEKIAQAELSQAEAGRYPTVNTFASYQVDHGFLSEENGDSWMAGIKMDYLLYDGKSRSSQITKAQLKLQKVKALKQKTELALNLETQQAQLDFEQAKKRLIVTKKMVKVAEEVTRLGRARFKEGVILASDLIELEKRLSDARSRYLFAVTGHRVAIAKLRNVAGLKQFPTQ